MTEQELERKARAEYEASKPAGERQIPWDDLPEMRRISWRSLVQEPPSQRTAAG